MGLASRANIDSVKTIPSMFEPVHGTAFDTTDQSKVNHLTSIFATAKLLEELGASSGAGHVNTTTLRVPNEGFARTADLDGAASTQQRVGYAATTCRSD